MEVNEDDGCVPIKVDEEIILLHNNVRNFDKKGFSAHYNHKKFPIYNVVLLVL